MLETPAARTPSLGVNHELVSEQFVLRIRQTPCSDHWVIHQQSSNVRTGQIIGSSK